MTRRALCLPRNTDLSVQFRNKSHGMVCILAHFWAGAKMHFKYTLRGMELRVIEGGKSGAPKGWSGLGSRLFKGKDGTYVVKRTLLGVVFAAVMTLTVIRGSIL